VQESARCTQVPRRKRVLQEVIGEGVQCISPLEITVNRPLDCSSVASVVRCPCIVSEVVPVYLRQSDATWDIRSAGRDFFEFPGHVGKRGVRDGWILVVH